MNMVFRILGTSKTDSGDITGTASSARIRFMHQETLALNTPRSPVAATCPSNERILFLESTEGRKESRRAGKGPVR